MPGALEQLVSKTRTNRPQMPPSQTRPPAAPRPAAPSTSLQSSLTQAPQQPTQQTSRGGITQVPWGGTPQGGSTNPFPTSQTPSSGTHSTASSTAAADPNVTRSLEALAAQAAALGTPIDVSGETQQMVDRSGSDIADRTAGAQGSLEEQMARRGIGGSGVAGAGARQLVESSQRDAAREGTNIRLAQAQRQQDMNMRRQDQLNSVLGMQANAAMGPAQLALQQQQFGMQQASLEFQMQMERERARQADMERQRREAEALNNQTRSMPAPLTPQQMADGYGGNSGGGRRGR
jgi:hypothetical protein